MRKLLAILALLFLSTTASATTHRWIGAAQDVPQITTSTASGTFAAGETIYAEINNKRITVTVVGASFSTTDAAKYLADAINAADNDDVLGAEGTYDYGGQQYGEWKEVTATASGAVLTLTGNTPGMPFTVTFGDSATSGAMGAATAAQAPTGKNWFNNADNWDTALAGFAAGDTMLFDVVAPAVMYGMANTTQNLNVTRTDTYKGDIGLPDINSENSVPYREYRQVYLSLPLTATSGSSTQTIGELNSGMSASGMTRLDFGTNDSAAVSVLVNNAPAKPGNADPLVQLSGGYEVSVTVSKGGVGIGLNRKGNNTEIQTLTMLDSSGSSSYVMVGNGISWDSGTKNIYLYGGTLVLNDIFESPYFYQYGGTCILQDETASSFLGMYLYGGTFRYLKGGNLTPNIYGGATFDMTFATNGITSSDQPQLYSGYRYIDPYGNCTWSNGIDFIDCAPGTDAKTGQVFTVRKAKNWKETGL